jgi:four helix bundle protein
MRRAVVSIPSNISEGWGRGSQANLANFVRIARGSHCELDTLIELAKRSGLISEETFKEVDAEMATVGRKMYAFLKSVESSLVREERKPYDLEPEDQELTATLSTFAP